MASEYFHESTPYSLDPLYKNSVFYKGASPYIGSFKSLSSAVDPRTANQVKEVQETLNTGIKNIEVGNVQPNVFEAIPKEHFKEMQRMAKLTGAELSFHAPMIDPTGITDHGWDKMNQEAAERQLWNAIQKGAELNPEKGTVVTFHATSVGLPGAEVKVIEDGKPVIKSIMVIDRSSGKVGQIKEEKKYFGTEGKEPLPFNPKEELDRLNEEAWLSRLSNANFSIQRGSAEVRDYQRQASQNPLFKAKNIKELEKEKHKLPEGQFEALKTQYEVANKELTHSKLFLRDAYRSTRELFDEVYKNASDEQQKELREYAKKVTPFINDFENLEKSPEKMKEFADTVESALKLFGNMKPKIYEPIKDFAIEKSAETTANLAWKAYNEFEKKGKAAPIIALENHPAQASLLTTGEELRDVIEKAHDDFVAIAKKEGMSEGDARAAAKRLIGATWDVGHINMLKKYGYGDKKILEETEAVAPHVKKIHLSDNFGFEHTELPMGMGNVPMEKIMKEINSRVGEKGFEIKKIIEAGDWWQHFSPGGKTHHPFVQTLYPSFSNVYGVPSGYFAGYGTMLPEQNFSMYGAGFTALPMELGGQVQSKDSKVSGTPMA